MIRSKRSIRGPDNRPRYCATQRSFGARLQVGDATLRPHALPRAAAMLPLAQALWDSGGAVDAALALPLYLRDKVAQTTLERESARALKAAVGVAS